MRTKMISREEAKKLAEKMGIDFRKDFHTLYSSEVSVLLDIRKLNGYRKPKNANGSTGRYFYAYLQRSK
jgi:hypothetical protein